MGLRFLKLRRWMNCVRVKDKMHTLKYWMKSSARLVTRGTKIGYNQIQNKKWSNN